MQTNPYPDPDFYSNIHDETACINKYAQYGNYPHKKHNENPERIAPLLKVLATRYHPTRMR